MYEGDGERREWTHLLLALCQRLLERSLHHLDRIDLVVLDEQLVLDIFVPRKFRGAVCGKHGQ